MRFAWRKYPLPDGTTYSEKDLESQDMVIQLFDYCQILEAAIFEHGWRKLLEYHGIDILISLNKISGWFDEDYNEAKADIKYFCLTSGYNPLTKEFGSYDVDTEIFTNEQGVQSEYDWSLDI